ncbi:hypothetical protein DPMN_019307 [Dreissena polymorpha]|uniref:Uncharacterized protein n=1 Tax=Dreissena polymorpha TaxID=45954 RepID=A0A9D4NES9_DREPO|nr:hypothetical protein DPMN_019307 [Dreissena polymorpha]
MLMTPVSVMAALEVSVDRHLLTSMKSPQITSKRTMIAMYYSTAEEKADTNILGEGTLIFNHKGGMGGVKRVV